MPTGVRRLDDVDDLQELDRFARYPVERDAMCSEQFVHDRSGVSPPSILVSPNNSHSRIYGLDQLRMEVVIRTVVRERERVRSPRIPHGHVWQQVIRDPSPRRDRRRVI